MTGFYEHRPEHDAFLLNRPEHSFDDEKLDELLKGQRVIVTGAAGSIGSAVCRRISMAPVEAILCIDHSENAVFHLRESLKHDIRIQYLIYDIRHPLWGHFSSFRPDIVVHAAAYKHVGFMESQWEEAYSNNSIGARYVAEAAAGNAEKFVFISTDKAAKPSTMMGFSKRFAELTLLRHFPKAHVVRFGNVLGSSGSLVEILSKQILAGGPVTLTDPAMRRYFITSREAVGLILTSVLCFDPGFYSLDMGDPLSLQEVAEKLMICHNRKVSIRWTGKLLEEKINEDLLNPGEYWKSTGHPGIRQICFSTLDFKKIDECLYLVEECDLPPADVLQKLG